MEHADSPQREARQAEPVLSRRHVLLVVSSRVLGATDSHQVARAKGQLGQSVEDLRACRNISCSGLCQCSLGRRNIEQAAHAVAIRFDSRGVGVARGLQECGGRLSLPQCCLQIRVASPYLTRNLIQHDLGLSRSRIVKCLGPLQSVFSGASIEERPVEAQRDQRCQVCGLNCGERRLPPIVPPLPARASSLTEG